MRSVWLDPIGKPVSTQPVARYSFSPKPAVGFGNLATSLTGEIAKNQVLSRLVIEILGYDPWIIGLARNNYERIEKVFDTTCRLTIATGAPILIEKALNPVFARHLTRKFKLPKGLNPLKMPFELLDPSQTSTSKLIKELPHYVFKEGAAVKLSPQQIQNLARSVQRFSRGVMVGKLGIVLIDLLMMATKGQVSFWGKNYLTEKLSGRKGFSGEFKITSNDYLNKKAEAHERLKPFKMAMSMGIGYASTLLLPLLLYGVVRMPKPMAKQPVGKLKQLIPFFNYHNAVYMSKWVLLWHHLFNNISPGLWAARDQEEFREHLTKSVSYTFFFSVGDDIITGQFAKLLQKANKKKLDGIKLAKKGPFGFPSAKHFYHVYVANPKTKAQVLANKLAGRTFWFGIITTALSLGIVTTLLNNWYTTQKVLREQYETHKDELHQLQQAQPTYAARPPQRTPNQKKPLRWIITSQPPLTNLINKPKNPMTLPQISHVSRSAPFQQTGPQYTHSYPLSATITR